MEGDRGLENSADSRGAWRRDEPSASSLSADGKELHEPARRTPVAADVDVLVVGGGPAGVGATLAAAREGARTLLVERHGMLGGMWTVGLVNPFFDPHKGWIVGELTQRLEASGGWQRHRMEVFDVESMKYVLENMMAQAGARYWYHCLATEPIVSGRRVVGGIVEGKSARQAVSAKVVIDCTGDGDVAARAGVPFEIGRASDGLCQPMTLMFELEGVQGEARVQELFRAMQEAMKSLGEAGAALQLPYGPNRSGTPFLISLPASGVAAIQATHVYKLDATSTADVTAGIAAARKQVHEVFLPILRRVPGLEGARLRQTAATVGLRESRRLEGRYRLELDDMIQGRRFTDAVTSIGFHIDVHEIDPENPDDVKLPELPEGMTRHNIPHCDIPYRSLVPKDVEGLMFAGRCISGSHVVHSAYRVTGTCMAMGQAAGLAAAMAVARGIEPGLIDGSELHAELAKRGAEFLPDR